jgi:hypothetical protein
MIHVGGEDLHRAVDGAAVGTAAALVVGDRAYAVDVRVLFVRVEAALRLVDDELRLVARAHAGGDHEHVVARAHAAVGAAVAAERRRQCVVAGQRLEVVPRDVDGSGVDARDLRLDAIGVGAAATFDAPRDREGAAVLNKVGAGRDVAEGHALPGKQRLAQLEGAGDGFVGARPHLRLRERDVVVGRIHDHRVAIEAAVHGFLV